MKSQASAGSRTPLGTLVALVMTMGAATVQAAPPIVSAATYCTDTGGKVENYRFYDFSDTEFGKPAWVCNYPDASGTDPTGHAIIDLFTLYAEKPTRAALAYYSKLAWDGKLTATPAKDYCLQLGGLPTFSGSWRLKPNSGEVGMCMFEDGSYMEEWTLAYNQAGKPRGVDLRTVMRFLMRIPIPVEP